jgi:hypothetical protein
LKGFEQAESLLSKKAPWMLYWNGLALLKGNMQQQDSLGNTDLFKVQKII